MRARGNASLARLMSLPGQAINLNARDLPNWENKQKHNMDLLYWLLAILCLVLAFVFGLPRALYTFYIKWKAVRNIPGLPTHWLLGNVHQVAKMFQHEEEAMKFLKYVCDNKFKVTALWMGPFQPFVGIHHCSLVGKVFTLPKYKDGYRFLKPWLGDGLLISEGSKWF